MDRDEALKLLKGGPNGIAEWHRRRREGESIPCLQGADLGHANLRCADLSSVNLNGTDLSGAKLDGADFSGANLSSANLAGADLGGAHLRCADFSNAYLGDANLRRTKLGGANLTHTTLGFSNLSDAKVNDADFAGAIFESTIIGNVDLSRAKGLESIPFYGACTLGTDTLARSRGRIPESFLRGCGLQEWEVLAAKMYDPDLSSGDISELQYKIFDLRTKGPLLIGGVFISYSSADRKFAEKLRDRLMKDLIRVWMDRHDLVAGDIQKQVDLAIRLHDVMVVVLSEASVNSDWVEKELQDGREKEKKEKRDVLCPVALDNSWNGKQKKNDVNWRNLFKKNVVDFSKWQEESQFEEAFTERLLPGLKIFYEPNKGDQTVTEGCESK